YAAHRDAPDTWNVGDGPEIDRLAGIVPGELDLADDFAREIAVQRQAQIVIAEVAQGIERYLRHARGAIAGVADIGDDAAIALRLEQAVLDKGGAARQQQGEAALHVARRGDVRHVERRDEHGGVDVAEREFEARLLCAQRNRGGRHRELAGREVELR